LKKIESKPSIGRDLVDVSNGSTCKALSFIHVFFFLLETSIVVDFGSGRVQTVHAGILSGPARQPEPDAHGLNQHFIRAAAIGDLAAVESILGGGGGAGLRIGDPEMISLPDR